MREFDPDDPLARRETRDADGDGAARVGIIGLFAVLAVAVMVGLFFWSRNDSVSTTATNTRPGVTTGSSTTSPPPVLVPPSKDNSASR